MKSGKAYGYFAYEGESSKLIEDMNRAKKETNFPKTLSLTVLEDKVSGISDPKREKLPAKIEVLANSTKVYGSALTNCSPKISRELSRIKPVKASSLRYLIMAEDPEACESSHEHAWGAGIMTAGRLGEILDYIGHNTCGISRNAVFYLDGRGRAQEVH